MPPPQKPVTSASVESAEWELPSQFVAFGLSVVLLKEHGLWQQIEERLRINRRGYQGIDLVIVLLSYWLSHRSGGLKSFLSEEREGGALVAKLAGRDGWATQSSVSRGLQDVELEDAHEFGTWLLDSSVVLGKELLTHDATYGRDAHGQPLRVFHADGQVHAIRRRALPEGDDLPPARRWVFGEPGYFGRKRGEVGYTVTALQEAGSGLFSAATLSVGTGHLSRELGGLTELAEGWIEVFDDNPDTGYVITDGEGGGRGQAIVGARSTLRFITRLSCYELLSYPEVMRHLAEGRWKEVIDSRSGPRRWALELGTIQLRDVRVRVVVSRFETDAKSGAGKWIDGWQYELYAADEHSIEQIPANDLVTMYYGRNALENSFASTNREFAPPQILSTNPGGQYLAVVTKLFAWNLETILGAHYAEVPPLADVPGWRDEPIPDPNGTLLPALPDSSASSAHGASASVSEVAVEQYLQGVDWDARLPDGWSYDSARRQIICEHEEPLTLQAISPKRGHVELRFRGSTIICSNCPGRLDCSTSKSKKFRREICVRMPTTDHDLTANALQWEPPRAVVLPENPVRPARLAKAEIRSAFQIFVSALTISVLLSAWQPAPQPSPYIISSRGQRQNRRQTWAERLAWNALERSVSITISGNTERATERLDRLLPNACPERASGYG